MVRDTLTCTLSSIKYLHTKFRETLTRIRTTVLNNHNTYALHVVLWNPRVTAIGSRISSLSPSASWLFHIPSLSVLLSRFGIVFNLAFRQNNFCIWQLLYVHHISYFRLRKWDVVIHICCTVLWKPRVNVISSRISSLSPSISWLYHIPSLSALVSRSGIVSNLVFRQNDFCIWQLLQYTFTIYLISVYVNGTSYIYVVSTYLRPRACIGILFLRVKYKKRLRLAG